MLRKWRRNWLGETRKEEMLRRVEALEANLNSVNARINKHDADLVWVVSWHASLPNSAHGQYTPPPEET